VAEATPTDPFPDRIPGAASVPPADIDNDGKFEDVNGDGELTFDDAIALAFADTSGFTLQQVAAVDFDEDGDVDFDDAIALAFDDDPSDEPTTNPFPDGIPGAASVPPADIDNDGKFEDVNGDGELTFDDAIALAFADTSGFTLQQVAAVDFDEDGDVDFDDAIALAFE
jgi:PKD repeat protein